MLDMLSTPGTELLNRQPIGIVPTILFRVIDPFPAFIARESDEDSVRPFWHTLFYSDLDVILSEPKNPLVLGYGFFGCRLRMTN